MRSDGLAVRLLKSDEASEVLKLEEAIWKPRGIETAPLSVLEAWAETGLFLVCFAGERLVGYAYCEEISFSPVPPYSEELLGALESYKNPRRISGGNTLHGLSMATLRPGAGGLLLDTAVAEARKRGLRYFVSLARLAGLARFVEENGLGSSPTETVAALYAIQAVSREGLGGLVGPPLSLLALPDGFPKIRRKDPVAGRFARLGKELWGVARTSFEDPESLGYSALLVLPL